MNTETKKDIISEFQKMRNENLKSNTPIDDIKAIGNFAKKLKIEFAEVVNVLENRSFENAKSNYLPNFLNPFSKKQNT